ncbi:hypothetical protein CK203_016901 [Vitis vinifera]|uniref:Retrotransposon gag domain-containing protein n=1 Tax=Vitis vinifera TaxID=29760 RepID=A0A438JNE1_VITVI|nr:hypothetical protein CK203_016901 [Vitis vinifera]
MTAKVKEPPHLQYDEAADTIKVPDDSTKGKASDGVFEQPVRTSFAGEWKEASLSVEWAKLLGSYNASRSSLHQHWRRLWEATFTKMSTPSRSRSSAMGDEGPPCDQWLRGQGTNSRHNQEATYPGNVEPFPDMCGVRLNKGPLPTYLAPDPFDHIMHYRQLMTLDIGNDALLCKVFPASLQGQTLSWFHRLPMNSVDNFWDLSETFVGQY